MKYITIILFLINSSIAFTQSNFQAAIGLKSSGYARVVNIDNTLNLYFQGNDVTRNAYALYYAKKLSEKFNTRFGGLIYTEIENMSVSHPDRPIQDGLGNAFRWGQHLHLIADIQWKVLPNVYVTGGTSVSGFLYNEDLSTEYISPDASQYWTSEQIDDIQKLMDVYRDITWFYRYGIMWRPFKRIGVETMWIVPITNVVKSPQIYQGEEVNLDVRYRTITIQLHYFFQIGKNKENKE